MFRPPSSSPPRALAEMLEESDGSDDQKKLRTDIPSKTAASPSIGMNFGGVDGGDDDGYFLCFLLLLFILPSPGAQRSSHWLAVVPMLLEQEDVVRRPPGTATSGRSTSITT